MKGCQSLFEAREFRRTRPASISPVVDPATGICTETAVVMTKPTMPPWFPIRSRMMLRSCLNLHRRLRSRSLRCCGPQRSSLLVATFGGRPVSVHPSPVAVVVCSHFIAHLETAVVRGDLGQHVQLSHPHVGRHGHQALAEMDHTATTRPNSSVHGDVFLLTWSTICTALSQLSPSSSTGGCEG